MRQEVGGGDAGDARPDDADIRTCVVGKRRPSVWVIRVQPERCALHCVVRSGRDEAIGDPPAYKAGQGGCSLPAPLGRIKAELFAPAEHQSGWQRRGATPPYRATAVPAFYVPEHTEFRRSRSSISEAGQLMGLLWVTCATPAISWRAGGELLRPQAAYRSVLAGHDSCHNLRISRSRLPR